MTFTSLSFIGFFFATTVLYYTVPQRFQWVFLLVASNIFYFFIMPAFLPLLWLLILINFFAAKKLDTLTGERKKGFIILLVIFNIGLLVLKYFKFFPQFFSPLDIHFQQDPFAETVLFPVGLSYFIFTVMSYLFEVKAGHIKPENHLGIFATYLLFFPKIVQGPIERPQSCLTQFHDPKSLSFDNITEGSKLMVWGFFKKMVIADRLGIFVNDIYSNPHQHNGTTLAVVIIFFSFQIYADFSGYTDIALGTAKVLGFNLTNNFRRPFFSTSIKDFWQRWHITLSFWLRDYIFLPLAYFFSRKLKKETYLNIKTDQIIYSGAIFITFFICGVWHGKEPTFMLWGISFAVLLIWERMMGKPFKKLRSLIGISKNSGLHKTFKIFLTFILVSLIMVFFRSETVSDAFYIIRKAFSGGGTIYYPDLQCFLYCCLGIGILMTVESFQEFKTGSPLPFISKSWFREQFVYAVLVIAILLTGVMQGDAFLYMKY